MVMCEWVIFHILKIKLQHGFQAWKKANENSYSSFLLQSRKCPSESRIWLQSQIFFLN